MAKINATYSSGYYLAPDVDYRKLEEEQRLERKRKKLDADVTGHSDRGAIRQTFAMPFNVICLHCNSRIARGTHGYVNRRATGEKYMGIRVWELEVRCMFCRGHIYLKTDYETAKLTGGYHCSRNCKRGEGDFYGTNQINEEIRTQQASEKGDEGTADALERENEVMLQLQERERQVEELVEAKAAVGVQQTRDELLQVIRAKQRQEPKSVGAEVSSSSQLEGKQSMEEEEEAYHHFEAQLRLWSGKDSSSAREQQLEAGESTDGDGEKSGVIAAVAARYTDDDEQRRNIFIEDSEDSDEDCAGRKSEPPPNQQTKLLAGLPSGCTAVQSKRVSFRRTGSALASLFDD